MKLVKYSLAVAELSMVIIFSYKPELPGCI